MDIYWAASILEIHKDSFGCHNDWGVTTWDPVMPDTILLQKKRIILFPNQLLSPSFHVSYVCKSLYLFESRTDSILHVNMCFVEFYFMLNFTRIQLLCSFGCYLELNQEPFTNSKNHTTYINSLHLSPVSVYIYGWLHS